MKMFIVPFRVPLDELARVDKRCRERKMRHSRFHSRTRGNKIEAATRSKTTQGRGREEGDSVESRQQRNVTLFVLGIEPFLN